MWQSMEIGKISIEILELTIWATHSTNRVLKDFDRQLPEIAHNSSVDGLRELVIF